MQFTAKYIKYLKSDSWKKKSALIRRIDNYTCQICGFDARNNSGGRLDHGHLEVHHLTYKRLFCEWTIDLVTLCQACHGDITVERKTGNSLDGALETVCLRLGVVAGDVRLKIKTRSGVNAELIVTEKFFTPKPNVLKRKKRKTGRRRKTEKKGFSGKYIYAVSGRTTSGLFSNFKSAIKTCHGNSFGMCKKFKVKEEAKNWIQERAIKLDSYTKNRVKKLETSPITPLHLNLVNENNRLVING